MTEEQNRNIPKLVPWYAAKVEHLRPGTSVGVICNCGHAANIMSEAIQDSVAGYVNVKELGRHLRCERCEKKGDVTVNARSALGYT